MQGALTGVLQGFGTLFSTPALLIALVLGLAAGLVVGVLPGLGATAGVAIILPFTYTMDPTFALIFATTVYVGGVFGGSAPAILFNMPGEASAAATAIDGYPMRQNGEASKALGTMITSSATGGLIGVLALLFISPLLADVALAFGPIQYFGLILFAMTIVGSIGTGSILGGYSAGALGLLLATIGSDPIAGAERFTFGITDLVGGVDFIVVMIGAFALAEVFRAFRATETSDVQEQTHISGQILSFRDYWENKWVNLRSGIVGTLVGILPGAGSTPASFFSYGLAKTLSRTPERFGRGSAEGVAAPEAANNSAAMGSIIPLLTLGIPGGAVTAAIFGIFLIHGLTPGPLLFINETDVVYPLIAALFIANALQLVIGVPQAKYLSKILQVPRAILYTSITLLCVIGAYAIENSMLDVWIMLVFAVISYFMSKYSFSVPALVLGLILGGQLESSFGQGVILSGGNPVSVLTDPIAGIFLMATMIVVGYQIVSRVLKWHSRGSKRDDNA